MIWSIQLQRFLVNFGTTFKQESGDLKVALLDGEVKRGPAVFLLFIDASAPLQQQLCEVIESGTASSVKCCAGIVCLGINKCPVV